MFNRLRYLVYTNLILFISLILLNDPFHFFPNTYETSPLFLEDDIEYLTQMEWKFQDEGSKVGGKFTPSFLFKKENNFWKIVGEDQKEKIADLEKIKNILRYLNGMRRFDRDRMIFSSNQFYGDTTLRLTLFIGDIVLKELEFGRCFQIESECLMRELNSNFVYTIPFSMQKNFIGKDVAHFYSTLPFGYIKQEDVLKVTYNDGKEKGFILEKIGDRWQLTPALEGELDSQKVADFLKRVLSWSGESIPKGRENIKATSDQNLQALTVTYRINDESQTTISVYDQTNQGSKSGKVSVIMPYEQTLLMQNYSWDYWRYFDVRQLLTSID